MSLPVSTTHNRHFLAPAGVVAYCSLIAASVYVTSRGVFTWCNEAVAYNADGIFSHYFKGLIQNGMTCVDTADRAKLIVGLGVALLPLAVAGAYKTASLIKNSSNIRQLHNIP